MEEKRESASFFVQDQNLTFGENYDMIEWVSLLYKKNKK